MMGFDMLDFLLDMRAFRGVWSLFAGRTSGRGLGRKWKNSADLAKERLGLNGIRALLALSGGLQPDLKYQESDPRSDSPTYCLSLNKRQASCFRPPLES